MNEAPSFLASSSSEEFLQSCTWTPVRDTELTDHFGMLKDLLPHLSPPLPLPHNSLNAMSYLISIDTNNIYSQKRRGTYLPSIKVSKPQIQRGFASIQICIPSQFKYRAKPLVLTSLEPAHLFSKSWGMSLPAANISAREDLVQGSTPSVSIFCS